MQAWKYQHKVASSSAFYFRTDVIEHGRLSRQRTVVADLPGDRILEMHEYMPFKPPVSTDGPNGTIFF